MNQTEAGFLARGIDRRTATRLREDGWTLARLKATSKSGAKSAGLNASQIRLLQEEGRPPIPTEALIAVLFTNRFTCCVCRDGKASIVVHHIVPWAKSHSHAAKNLAVVCLNCHSKAHTTGDLVLNLTARRLKDFKAQWEAKVEKLDPRAILDAARVNYSAWNYFNHMRLVELARVTGINLRRLQSFGQALTCKVVDNQGNILRPTRIGTYLYAGGYGIQRYAYVKEMMDEILEGLKVTNISDHLDRGTLPSILTAGDFIFVQGAHTFVKIKGRAGESCRGSRKANGIEISYVFDRKEATSNSAWSMWLRGRQDAGSLVQVRSVRGNKDKLFLQGTVFGISSALQGLKQRVYEMSLFKSGLPKRDYEDMEVVI